MADFARESSVQVFMSFEGSEAAIDVAYINIQGFFGIYFLSLSRIFILLYDPLW